MHEQQEFLNQKVLNSPQRSNSPELGGTHAHSSKSEEKNKAKRSKKNQDDKSYLDRKLAQEKAKTNKRIE